MSIEKDFIDLFDRVVGKQATAEELLEFERKKTENKDFAEDFEAYKIARRGLELEGFKADISEVRNGEQRKKSILVRLIPVGIAASILLGIVIFNKNQRAPHLALFEKHFTAYPYLFQARTSNSDHSNEEKAVIEYQKGKYKEAISLMPGKVENDTLLFFKGLSFLALQQADSALQNFNQLPKSNFIFDEEVLWYKGLTYLLLQKKDSTQFYLQSVPSSSKHQQHAEAIIQQLQAN